MLMVNRVKETLRGLVDKYSGGFEAWAKERNDAAIQVDRALTADPQLKSQIVANESQPNSLVC